jgi:hypothetical protein
VIYMAVGSNFMGGGKNQDKSDVVCQTFTFTYDNFPQKKLWGDTLQPPFLSCMVLVNVDYYYLDNNCAKASHLHLQGEALLKFID